MKVWFTQPEKNWNWAGPSPKKLNCYILLLAVWSWLQLQLHEFLLTPCHVHGCLGQALGMFFFFLITHTTVPLQPDVQIMCHGRLWTEQIWVSLHITSLDEHPLKQVKICTKKSFLCSRVFHLKRAKISVLYYFTNFFGTFFCHVTHHNSWWTFSIMHHRLWTFGH